MMEAEMDDHLGYQKSEGSDSDDYRNGYKSKRVNSSYGSNGMGTLGQRFQKSGEWIEKFNRFIILTLMQHKNRIYISYDSTNKNCQAGDIDLAEFGHAKDDKSKRITEREHLEAKIDQLGELLQEKQGTIGYECPRAIRFTHP